MQLIQGSGWKAHFDDERNLYTARTSVPGAIYLYEINKEVFEELQTKDLSDDDKYCLIHDKGRSLYMDIDDRRTRSFWMKTIKHSVRGQRFRKVRR